jgi:hypothetical protein
MAAGIDVILIKCKYRHPELFLIVLKKKKAA